MNKDKKKKSAKPPQDPSDRSSSLGSTTIRISKEMHATLGRLGKKLMPPATANALGEACVTSVLEAAISDSDEAFIALKASVKSALDRLTDGGVDFASLLAHDYKEKAKIQSDPNHSASPGKGHG